MASVPLKWLGGRSIRWQLIGGVAILQALLMTVLVIGLLRWEQHFLLAKAQAQAESEAAILATSSQEAVLTNDSSSLSELLADLSNSGAIRDAMVTDPNGKVLARFQSTTPPAFLSDAETQLVLHGRPITRSFHESADTETAVAPIVAQGRTIGWAWVKNDLSGDRVGLKETVVAGLVYALLSVGVGTLFARRVSGSILRPLRLLQDGVARFAADRLDEPIPITSTNEVAIVSTAFNSAMERLARQQKELHDEMAERARAQQELSALYTEAAESNRVKDHFLAVLSHELRTPLTPVLTLAQMLERDTSLAQSVREDITTIRRNVELEVHLIDDLLDLTRIKRGKMELRLTTVNIHEKLREAVRMCQGEADAKGLKIGLELRAGQATVRGDAMRLSQVFWNLVRNAIKFTPPGGWILIHTHLEPSPSPNLEETQEGISSPPNDLLVDVSDSGAGIEPEMLSRIFEAFEQGGRETTRVFGGLGLGLTISQALVQLHGGKLTARSEGRDRGSTFTVRLPIGSIAAQGTASTVSAPPAGKGRRILLVEDHADTAVVTARLLAQCGYDVQTAGNVADAIQLARSRQFDLIVSDIGLPDGTGHELLRQLVAEAPDIEVKGIAVSGFGRGDDVRRSHEAGFSDHLVKPVDTDVLLNVVEKALEDQSSSPPSAG